MKTTNNNYEAPVAEMIEIEPLNLIMTSVIEGGGDDLPNGPQN
jgi:hypothetical protein